jgi:2-polyprenyl-3-methyl-5-hydroxy-6-metoxy-1,4-benzoquinol methylase
MRHEPCLFLNYAMIPVPALPAHWCRPLVYPALRRPRAARPLFLHMHALAGMKVLDCGCGVGGPMRTIASVSGAHVTGKRQKSHLVLR